MSSKILAERLKEIIQGEVLVDSETLEKYSRDASLFKVRPQVVVFPKNEKDLEKIVNFTLQNKKEFPNLSITARSAGTDMSGGAIGEGIVLDFTKHFTHQEVDLETLRAIVEPGVYYRDFEKITLPEHVSMPVYPASKGLAALGGMIMNNCGSENSLRYGQMRNFVEKIDAVLVNGREYTFKKLSMTELEYKMNQQDFEGQIYRQIFELIDKNYDLIKSAKPKTVKNSSGYALWDVYDKEAGTFDLAQLFTGSQGTLGLMTSAEIRVMELKEHKRLVTLFLKSWDDLPSAVNKLLPIGAQSMETFDDTTLKLGIRFMPEIAKKSNTNLIKFLFKFWPEFIIGLKLGGLPKLIVLVEIAESTEKEADKKVEAVIEALKGQALHYRVIADIEEAEKYWTMRRESFNLLREKVKDKQTAPFIDDVCVLPEKLPQFLPKIIKILKKHKIAVNIVGHAGEGNLHIIPLMNLKDPLEREKIPFVSDEVYKLVLEYGGTITAEHNDGIIRTPYVRQMFGDEMYKIFQQTKNIFDPNNIFNPGKKVGGTLEYLKNHIVGK
ncbi:MAG: FAD-binding oxidoreductase [Candidatus Pacebacteria bacterium]|nr:FAD-binding oxidoreductase [Candidatus Paceibacterota bacterium]